MKSVRFEKRPPDDAADFERVDDDRSRAGPEIDPVAANLIDAGKDRAALSSRAHARSLTRKSPLKPRFMPKSSGSRRSSLSCASPARLRCPSTS